MLFKTCFPTSVRCQDQRITRPSAAFSFSIARCCSSTCLGLRSCGDSRNLGACRLCSRRQRLPPNCLRCQSCRCCLDACSTVPARDGRHWVLCFIQTVSTKTQAYWLLHAEANWAAVSPKVHSYWAARRDVEAVFVKTHPAEPSARHVGMHQVRCRLPQRR